MKSALILAGHGSHISPETAGLVWQHVDALRRMQVADEVTAAFWKEMPSFHTVFSSLEATDITVVPLFTAQGYFTQTVIPAEMGLIGEVTTYDGRTIRYARTLSEHPYLGQIVRQRVDDALRNLGSTPNETAVAVVGHSTRRNPESRKATEAQADAIRQSGVTGEVVAVYLDDTPDIGDAYRLTHSPYLIVVPYFLTNGSHTTIDVPEALGLPDGQREGMVQGRHVYYTQPVGVEDDLRAALLELARDAGAPLRSAHANGSAWACFPSANRTGLQDLLTQTNGVIGQLRVTQEDVRHVDDPHPDTRITEPDILRHHIRENPFRPHATRTDLPRGWYVPTNGDIVRVHAVIETIYPGLIGAMRMPTGSFEALLARQSGRYRELEQLTHARRNAVMQQVCGHCVRHPQWAQQLSHGLICPEPCDMWLSTALQMMKGENEA